MRLGAGRPTFAFTPGDSPLHRARASVAVAFLGAFALIAFLFLNPLVLLADGIAVAIVGLAAGARRAAAGALRLGLPLLVLMAVVNVLVNHRGETVLLRGWDFPVVGNTDVTLESFVFGGAIGMRVVVVFLAFAVYSACVDPDRVLRALRPLARRSALTAALVVRMVPVAAGDLSRVGEAAALRGPGAEPVGRGLLLRRLVEGSMDRAIDVAATMELRGHSLDPRPVPRREVHPPAWPLLLAGAGVLVTGAVALALGGGGFDAFPAISIDAGATTVALCAALPLLAVLPFAGRIAEGRRG
jgi:energy-coupling factor transporter transmembrane protein EcfT